MFVFGSGVLIGTPSGGQPINFGLVQEVSLNVAVTTKALYGQYNFPVALGAGTKKMTGKAKMARISGQALGSLFFGATPAAGSTITQFGEATTVAAAGGAYTPTYKSTFVADQGVVYAASALPLKPVASAPAQGQYSVSGGVYTFSSADANKAVLISYTYASTTIGTGFAVNSALVGPTISFSANLFAQDPTNNNQQFSVLLYNCVAEKLSFGTKVEDFLMPELDFQCFANAAGQVCQFNFGDAA